ncbi:hypothetical protein OG413_43805 [Streptomyces sp. NBC_01433]|uniref:hypothetical protein n=1 Tax=Streptomyces sp. NBC_01433 TaxID=2903864 RepID=UPI002254BEB0|nr:hypothetical protein [Streptomyces sp. NBC_01433]MCX4682110.1 hypothetical protein [Streptomyces sp. NBC_01433]
MRAAVPQLVRGAILMAAVALMWWITGRGQAQPDEVRGVSDVFDQAVQDLFETLHSGIEGVWSFGATGVALIGGITAMETAGRNATLRELAEARTRYVQPSELVEEARTLLARAQQAKKTVFASSVHRCDLIDRQRNEAALPRQEWEIAEALLEYSRLMKAEPDDPRSSRVTAALQLRRRSLKTSLDGIERRVLALEAYADEVSKADDRYQELQQIQQLTKGSEDVLELLARTARDDLAVAEMEEMNTEAVAVAATFTAALESAREAAVIALPVPPKAA